MKTSCAVRSRDAICITFIKWNNCNYLLKWLWSLLGVSERAKKLRLKFDEISSIQIRTSTEQRDRSPMRWCGFTNKICSLFHLSLLNSSMTLFLIFWRFLWSWRFFWGKNSFLNPPTGFQIDPQPRPPLDHFHVGECLTFRFSPVCRLSVLMWEFK